MKNAWFLLFVWTIALVAGCETTKGAGRDIENTGENIQEGVRDMQN